MGILIIVVAIILYVLITYNSFVTLKNKIKQSRSSIDVYLTQRFDLIPNLVECVKAYMKHEENVMKKITELRSSYNITKDLNTGVELNGVCNQLLGLAENHPDLKASEQFLQLQKNLTKIESQLQAARRIYNSEVTTYNTKISVIPSNIFAKFFGFKEEELFKAEEEAIQNMKIEL